MKLLVIGASGYLGRAILKRAPAQWDVVGTYLTNPLPPERVNVLRLDIRDETAVSHAVEQVRPDVVIHTAALMSGEEMSETNAIGTRHVAAQANSAGARLIHLSSDVIFDGEHAPYDESAPPDPITSYAKSKALAEYAVQEGCLNAVVVRTSLIYGFAPPDPRTSQLVNGAMARLFTDEFRCPIFVDDLADALLELAGSEYRGVLNVAGPQRLSRYEFGVALARAYRGQPRFVPALSAPVSLSPLSAPEMRPRDCTLTIARAREVLRTPLRSVDQVLEDLQLPSTH